ncbi:hypothetical protein PHMEG_00027101, partial [Phytophthora megakarya]
RLVASLHGCPLSTISPSTALLRPEIQSRRELLPAPEGPIMASNSPGFAVPLTLDSIIFSSDCFV